MFIAGKGRGVARREDATAPGALSAARAPGTGHARRQRSGAQHDALPPGLSAAPRPMPALRSRTPQLGVSTSRWHSSPECRFLGEVGGCPPPESPRLGTAENTQLVRPPPLACERPQRSPPPRAPSQPRGPPAPPSSRGGATHWERGGRGRPSAPLCRPIGWRHRAPPAHWLPSPPGSGRSGGACPPPPALSAVAPRGRGSP